MKLDYNPAGIPRIRNPNQRINFSNKSLPNQFERNKKMREERIEAAKKRFPKATDEERNR